ncbi:MAG: hypothetical protein EOO22_00660 [Comamonadaceae bacterium]|nr:MAG: hypothetical protein EOO22_00660 [Comamonadaceae bacterium]
MYGIPSTQTPLRTSNIGGLAENQQINAAPIAQPQGKIKQLMHSITRFIGKFKMSKPEPTAEQVEAKAELRTQKAARKQEKAIANDIERKNLWLNLRDFHSFDLTNDTDLRYVDKQAPKQA